MKTRFSMNGFNMIITIIFWMIIGYFAGDCGMGIYITAYIIYGFLYMILMGSVMNTISKMVSVRCYRGLHENAKKVFNYGMLYSFLTGLFICILLLSCGNFLINALCGTTLPASVVKVFGVYFFVRALNNCLTGYYQGLGNVFTYNMSVFIKDILLIISAPFIVNIFYSYGEKVGKLVNNPLYAHVYGAMGAGILLCLTSIVTFLILILFFRRTIRNQNMEVNKSAVRGVDTSKSFLNNFLVLSFRILRSNLFPLTAVFALVILYINTSIKNGLAIESVFTNVGVIFGKLIVICLFPLCIFKEYVTKEKMKIHNDFICEESKNMRIRSGYFIKNSLFILLPITIMAITLAQPIVMIFFDGRMKLGVNMLRIGGVLILLGGMTMVLKSILTAIQKETDVLLYSLVSLVAAIVFAIVMFKKDTSISMLVYCFVLYYTIQVLLMSFAVYKQPRVILYEFKYRFIVMGIAGAIVAVAELILDYFLVMNVFLLILCVVIGYVLYLTTIFVLKGITKKDEQALRDSFIYLPIHFITQKLHLWN